MQIQVFQNNPLQVNTYILYDKTREAVIIDPGMSTDSEKEAIAKFIKCNDLKVKYIIATHPHIDHVLGAGFSVKAFGAPLWMHEGGLQRVYSHCIAYGVAFGLDCEKEDFPQPDHFVADGDEICFGDETLTVLETPGHCAGSICLYHHASGSVFVGDLVFRDSVGRSDLPTGDMQQLADSIQNKIRPLPDSTIIFPGHGPTTTVEHEKNCNPYFYRES